VGSTGSVGFLKDDASFTTINVPGALFTQPSGINDAGQIVGLFGDATSRDHGFLKDGAIFTTFDVPGATLGTFATGINDAGQIVGSFLDAMGNPHGFLKDGATFNHDRCSRSDFNRCLRDQRRRPDRGGVLFA
jgi:probable HAF family extracellular repeat protein